MRETYGTMRDQAKAEEYQQTHERSPQLSADKMYKVDPTFRRKPTAWCRNIQFALPLCPKGAYPYCYCAIPCSCQLAEDPRNNPNAPYASPEAKRLAEEEFKSAIKHSHDIMRHQRPEMETDIDEIVDNLIGSMGESAPHRRGRG